MTMTCIVLIAVQGWCEMNNHITRAIDLIRRYYGIRKYTSLPRQNGKTWERLKLRKGDAQ